MKHILFFSILIIAPSLFAEESEVITTPPEKQIEIFNDLAEKTFHAEKGLDEEGNIRWVIFNQAPQFKKQNPESLGLTDEDMEKMLHFHKLKGITLQRQRISNRGYQMLSAFKDLEVASLVDVASGKQFDEKNPKPDGDFILGLDACRNLKVLDITHSFRVGHIPLEKLKGFPELRVFIPDVGASDSHMIPFMKKSPKLEFIKLHRTTINDVEYAELLTALPNLKLVELKPNEKVVDRISHRSLALYKDHPSITRLILIQDGSYPLPWKDGLEYLVEAKNLKQFNYHLPYNKKETPKMKPEDIGKLKEARPDLEINGERTKVLVVDYDWMIGPR